MILGLIILLIGILFLLENIIPGFAVDFDLIFPVALIIFSIFQTIKNKKIDIFYSIICFIGIWLLLDNLKIMPEKLEDLFWPIIIIIIGLIITINSCNFKKKQKKIVNKTKSTNYYGIFSAIDEKVNCDDYKDCNIYAIFGAVELDLTNIKIKEDIVLNVYSIFGGCDIILPKEYNLIMNSNAFFGGNDNTCTNSQDGKTKTIHVNCISVFGGSEFKN